MARPVLASAGMGGGANGMEFSLNGDVLAVAGADGGRLWDRTADSPKPLPGTADIINKLAFSYDGGLLATAGTDGDARLWNMASRSFITRLPDPITKVVFSPKDLVLVAISPDGTTRLWDVHDPAHPTPLSPLPTGTAHRTQLGPTGSSVDVQAVFDHAGNTLAIAHDGTIQLWKVADSSHPEALGQPLTVGHSNITTMVFSQDDHDRVLITASSDGTVGRWQADTGQLIRTSQLTKLRPEGGFYPMAFSSNGHRLAVRGDEGTTTLWNVDSQQLIATLTGHNEPVSVAAFSGNNFLATASEDNTVRLWDLDEDAVTKKLCHIIGTVVSHEQWDSYLPLDTYRSTCP